MAKQGAGSRHASSSIARHYPWLIPAVCLLILYVNHASQSWGPGCADEPAEEVASTAAVSAQQEQGALQKDAAVPAALTDTIYVSLASYRDPFCQRTLQELFKTANRPERVFVGIADQINVTNPAEECLMPDFEWNKNIRVMQLSMDHGRGPCFARYLVSRLYQTEDYFFLTDSHMKWEQGWDDIIVDMYKRYAAEMGHEKIVISHYPMSFDPNTGSVIGDSKSYTSCHCQGFINDDNIWQPLDSMLTKEEAKRHYLVPVAGANMMFGPGKLVLDVPFDPFLPHLFHGEEILYSVRAWAKGYRVYSPDTNVVYHFYGRQGFRKSWDDHTDWWKGTKISLERTKLMLGSLERSQVESDPAEVFKDYDVYAPPRDLVEEWMEFFEIDMKNKKFSTNYCTNPRPPPPLPRAS